MSSREAYLNLAYLVVVLESTERRVRIWNLKNVQLSTGVRARPSHLYDLVLSFEHKSSVAPLFHFLHHPVDISASSYTQLDTLETSLALLAHGI
jgi:hypothetical protein